LTRNNNNNSNPTNQIIQEFTGAIREVIQQQQQLNNNNNKNQPAPLRPSTNRHRSDRRKVRNVGSYRTDSPRPIKHTPQPGHKTLNQIFGAVSSQNDI